eukprot:CAMPEP_0117463856 /NCGR_PEP_ID=MMETSP0784-20121206/3799_1 /TAXON_ID=39447 /ORGANISM="" /LENGTH=244 /DNA_ID=CAMNT_0005257693 /DNA_START=36 /DNA_END=767 /DNA_ORIENTATION=-
MDADVQPYRHAESTGVMLAKDAAPAHGAGKPALEVKKMAGASTYLEAYGYPAQGTEAWARGLVPEANVRVVAHRESAGHTHYILECTLAPCGVDEPCVAWATAKRLMHVRRDLHDLIKRELGKKYCAHFEATPFARRFGMPGTTARLDAWCQNLAACMSAGLLGPDLTEKVLRTLDVPDAQQAAPKSFSVAAESQGVQHRNSASHPSKLARRFPPQCLLLGAAAIARETSGFSRGARLPKRTNL